MSKFNKEVRPTLHPMKKPVGCETTKNIFMRCEGSPKCIYLASFVLECLGSYVTM